jgi:hypothetical protein
MRNIVVCVEVPAPRLVEHPDPFAPNELERGLIEEG